MLKIIGIVAAGLIVLGLVGKWKKTPEERNRINYREGRIIPFHLDPKLQNNPIYDPAQRNNPQIHPHLRIQNQNRGGGFGI